MEKFTLFLLSVISEMQRTIAPRVVEGDREQPGYEGLNGESSINWSGLVREMQIFEEALSIFPECITDPSRQAFEFVNWKFPPGFLLAKKDPPPWLVKSKVNPPGLAEAYGYGYYHVAFDEEYDFIKGENSAAGMRLVQLLRTQALAGNGVVVVEFETKEEDDAKSEDAADPFEEE